jgi:hypothetical protein
MDRHVTLLNLLAGLASVCDRLPTPPPLGGADFRELCRVIPGPVWVEAA